MQLTTTNKQGADGAELDTVQDFLIKLGIKPRMHLWEISISSLNSDRRLLIILVGLTMTLFSDKMLISHR